MPASEKPPHLMKGFNIQTAVLEPENFDRWLFADGLSEEGRQKRLDEILHARVEAAARTHRLSELQRAKLLHAGKGDIKRFFEAVEQGRHQFEIDRRNFNSGYRTLRNLDSLSQLYRDGPFGDGTLYAKMLRRIVSDSKAGP